MDDAGLRGIDWVLQFGRHGTVDGRLDTIDEIDRRTGYPPMKYWSALYSYNT
jgi:hypothetical protein